MIQALPGRLAEYERRHRAIWPEMKQLLSEHGVHRFSIFAREPAGQLFGYLELEDETRYEALAQHPVCQRWWKYMTEVLVTAPGSEKGTEELLREVFYME